MPDNLEILTNAVARNTPAVLSLPTAGIWRHLNTRFVGEAEGGLLIEAAQGTDALVHEAVSKKASCLVEFKHGTQKSAFVSPILQAACAYESGGSPMKALLLARPGKVELEQRRAHYRAPMKPGCGVTIRVWRLEDREYFKVQPPSAREMKGAIKNLSVGGIGMRFFNVAGAKQRIVAGERVRVLLTWGEEKLIMEGRTRAPGPAELAEKIGVTTGIHLAKLENDIEGRQIRAVLTKLVGEWQRAEAKNASESTENGE